MLSLVEPLFGMVTAVLPLLLAATRLVTAAGATLSTITVADVVRLDANNRLLVAHGPNLMDLMGYFPKEGTLVVLRPRGRGHFDYVASFAPGLWPQVLPAGALP